MSLLRIILAIILPPAAVYDMGMKKILIVLILWIICWLPGVLAAFYFLHNKK